MVAKFTLGVPMEMLSLKTEAFLYLSWYETEQLHVHTSSLELVPKCQALLLPTLLTTNHQSRWWVSPIFH